MRKRPSTLASASSSNPSQSHSTLSSLPPPSPPSLRTPSSTMSVSRSTPNSSPSLILISPQGGMGEFIYKEYCTKINIRWIVLFDQIPSIESMESMRQYDNRNSKNKALTTAFVSAEFTLLPREHLLCKRNEILNYFRSDDNVNDNNDHNNNNENSRNNVDGLIICLNNNEHLSDITGSGLPCTKNIIQAMIEIMKDVSTITSLSKVAILPLTTSNLILKEAIHKYDFRTAEYTSSACPITAGYALQIATPSAFPQIMENTNLSSIRNSTDETITITTQDFNSPIKAEEEVGDTDMDFDKNAVIDVDVDEDFGQAYDDEEFHTDSKIGLDVMVNDKHSRIDHDDINDADEVQNDFDIDHNVDDDSSGCTFTTNDENSTCDSFNVVNNHNNNQENNENFQFERRKEVEESVAVYADVMRCLGWEKTSTTVGVDEYVLLTQSFESEEEEILHPVSPDGNDNSAADFDISVSNDHCLNDVDRDRPSKHHTRQGRQMDHVTLTPGRPKRNLVVCGNLQCKMAFSFKIEMYMLKLLPSYEDQSDLPVIPTSINGHLICFDCYGSGYKLGVEDYDSKNYMYKRGTRQDYDRDAERKSMNICRSESNDNQNNDLSIADDSEDDAIIIFEDEMDYNPDSFIGRKLAKSFHGAVYDGVVKTFNQSIRHFAIEYDDGDKEEITLKELKEYMEFYEMRQTENESQISLREYRNEKSLWTKSLSFTNYLGRCRHEHSTFHWHIDDSSNIDLSNVVYFDKELGRVYFDKFVLHNKCFEVGDFIKESHEQGSEPFYYRIVGAFQAVKSFVGIWHDPNKNIQNRGNAYLQVAALVSDNKRERELVFWKDNASNSLQYKSIPIERLPLHVDEFVDSVVDKIEVKISENQQNSSQYYCVHYRKNTFCGKGKRDNPLEKEDYLLLTSDAATLLQEHIPKYWDLRFNSRVAIFINTRNDIQQEISPSDTDAFEVIYDSASDDSDEFDEDSRNFLQANPIAKKKPAQMKEKTQRATRVKKHKQRSTEKRGQRSKEKKSGPKKRKSPSAAVRSRKFAKPTPDDDDDWRIADSKGGQKEIVEHIMKYKEENLLKFIFRERMKLKLIDINNNNDPKIEEIPRKFTSENGSIYELASMKEDDSKDDNKFGSPTITMKAQYVQTSGPGLESINLQERLEEIADFASLSGRKAASRLELLQSPAAKFPQDYAIFKMSNEDVCEIEEDAHTGCGFISEDYLAELVCGHRTLEKCVCIQVRIYSPKFGIFKGVLMRKRIINGAKVQLPGSMKKVGPSKSAKKLEPLILINNAGLDPSTAARSIARLKCVDVNGDGGPKGKTNVPKRLTDMVERLWIGLGVPKVTVTKYAKDSREWKYLNHAYVRGVADPTGKLPPGQVYITGFKNKDTLSRLDRQQVFMTRLPAMKCNIAHMMKVITKKPYGMSDSDYTWLESLPFGALIFGFPNKGMLPIPETIEGDLDGDRFFLCWDEVILTSLRNMRRYVEVADPQARVKTTTTTTTTTYTSVTRNNENWLSEAQEVMESISGKEVKCLIGKLYNKSKKYATADEERGIRNPEAAAFADAYKDALDNGKHGNKIVLPRYLHKEITPNRFREYLTGP